jgi:hypothetical protein
LYCDLGTDLGWANFYFVLDFLFSGGSEVRILRIGSREKFPHQKHRCLEKYTLFSKLFNKKQFFEGK